MKRYIFLALVTILSIGLYAQTDSTEVTFEQANDLYVTGDYAQAAITYQTFMDTHNLTRQSQAMVFYNLGNAYFKTGELAQSILAYERCLRLRPTFRDARYNLTFAQSQIVDNIEDNQAFFVANWLKYIRNLLPYNTWLWISIICFSLFIASLIIFLLMSHPGWRKSAFAIAMIAIVMFICASANAWSVNRRDTLRSEAIVTRGIVNAKASPDRSGTELFTLHEGTKVTIYEVVGSWANIHVGNNIGWLPLNTIERI